MNAPQKVVTGLPVAEMIIRGRIISDDLVEMGGRNGDLKFLTPDAGKYIDQLPLGSPALLSDLYELSFEDLLDYIEMLGERMDVRTNRHLQQSRELTYMTSPQTKPLIDRAYTNIPGFFHRDRVRELAEDSIGVDYLEGWVESDTLLGSKVSVRCFGARTLHIVAGNAPAISVLSILRNIILRSDAIIKVPSNDPFTALAIAHTMVEAAPDHPITKHLSVAYWRGGDVDFEEKLYQPQNIEKIIAWGGFASVKHVTRYIQPGLELISLDPKRSASIVGREAFASEETMRDAARRLATDIGGVNQVGCVNSRVSYIMSGTDDAGLQALNRFGELVYDALLKLPEPISTKPKSYDRDLKEHVDSLRLDSDWFRVIGGREDEGAIIVSQLPQAVDFATMLNDRTGNLVPVDDLDEIISEVDAYTQTIGVYPEALKQELRDVLSLCGAQRFVSLGYATRSSGVGPQDGIEPMRRMGKWIIDENSDPAKVPPMWDMATFKQD